MDILSSIYERIIRCPPVPPETGGILGIQNGIICNFVYDSGLADGNKAVYIPDVERLNKTIRSWQTQDVLFAGMIHTHPIDQPSLSSADVEYINLIFSSLPKSVEHLFFPIVLPGIKILPFKASRNEDSIDILEDKINIITSEKEYRNEN